MTVTYELSSCPIQKMGTCNFGSEFSQKKLINEFCILLSLPKKMYTCELKCALGVEVELDYSLRHIPDVLDF